MTNKTWGLPLEAKSSPADAGLATTSAAQTTKAKAEIFASCVFM
ncbi:MAG: hypothetical protein P4M13_04800 [Alphaproteobacteria bacterium]|nr:hypothetical protein [Alphaproteobacteria bacterium]